MYLALDYPESGLGPDEADGRLYYEALTSVRQGSFIVVCMPKVLPKLQDSVRGSGSPMRALAFADEWPWSDGGTETFRFDGPVLHRLMDHWSSSEEARSWLKVITLDGLLPATAVLPDATRVQLLLNDILDSFSPDLYPELDDVVDQFFFHCGLPRIVSRENTSPPAYVRDVAEIAQRLGELRKRNPDFRAVLVKEIAPSTFPDIDDLEELQSALDLFLDGALAHGVDRGLLAFHGGLGARSTSDGVEDWRRLDIDTLRKLFGVGGAGKRHLRCTISISQGRGLVSSDGKHAAILHGVSVFLDIDAGIGEDQSVRDTFRIRCKRLQSIIGEHPCDSARVKRSIEIQPRHLPSGPRRTSIVVQLVQFGQVLEQSRVYIHVCGQGRPGLAIFEPGFEVFDLVPLVDGEPELDSVKLACREPVRVHVLDWEASSGCSVSVNEESTEVDSVGEPGEGECGILYLVQKPVDAEAFPGAHADVRMEASNRGREVTLAGDDVEPGEFTLEDEFRVAATLSSSGRLQRVLPFFRGDADLVLPKLGNRGGASRRRMDLASCFEGAYGWKPVILDFLRERDHVKEDWLQAPCCRYLSSLPAFLRDAQPSVEVRSAIAKYEECRDVVLGLAKEYVAGYSVPSERSLYVVAPIFVESNSVRVEGAVGHYVAAYLEALSLLETAQLAAHEIFALVHLDSVVFENGDLDEPGLDMRISLLGPWHPLVVAKRYMVQHWLYFAASDKRPATRRHRLLVSVFDRVDGFRVVPGFDADGLGLDLSFAFPTSDPGWHVALSKEAFGGVAGTEFGSLLRLGERLRSYLGLRSSFYPAGSELWSNSYVGRFLRSHPSRRQLGLRVSGGLDARRIADSCARLLEDTDRARIPLGPLLPGGIHLFLEDELEDRNPLKWLDPMVFVYENLPDKECFDHFQPDILLQPQGKEMRPAWPSLESIGHTPVPRGLGLGTVFFFPLVHLSKDRHGLPVSRVLESGARERGNGERSVSGGRGESSLGAIFLDVLQASERIARQVRQRRPALVQELGLPGSLRCEWTVLSGTDIDAGGLATDIAGAGGERALWDYQIDVGQSVNSYFVVCRVPKSVVATLSANPLALGAGGVSSALRELSEVGFAVGETMRSGKAAVGVLGVVGALRLAKKAWPAGGVSGRRWCTVLLPVDSFTGLLAPPPTSGGTSRRTDLLAVNLAWNLVGEPGLVLSPCAVECKYVSTVFQDSAVADGLLQAKATYDVFRDLLACALSDTGMHARLALGRLVRFGLRLLAARGEVDMKDEQVVLEAILTGSLAPLPPPVPALLVTTSCGATGPARVETRRDGWWVRLTAESWPRESSSPEDEAVAQIATVFPAIERAPSGPSESPPAVSAIGGDKVHPSGSSHAGRATPTSTVGDSPMGVTEERGPDSVPAGVENGSAGDERPDAERPPSAEASHPAFQGFVGNQPAVEALTIQLRYAEATGARALRPLGLFGPKSTGKTELARRVARALGVPELFLSETGLGDVDQLADRMQRRATEAGQPMQVQGREGGLAILRCPPMVVFIDEVHQLSNRVQDSLLPVLESDDRMLRGSGVIINGSEVSFIIATTDWGKLREAFRSRVRPIGLSPYTAREVARMLRLRIELQSDVIEGAAAIDPAVARLGEEALLAISTAARAVPRVAIELLREVGMALRIGRCDTSTEKVWQHLQRLVPCDRDGLTPQDRKYLRILASRGPVGLDNIAVELGIDRSNVSGAIEPFLVQMGWVQLAPAGRVLTAEGARFLRGL